MKPEILSYPERFSLIYSEHPFIVPGGRFVEFYYWWVSMSGRLAVVGNPGPAPSNMGVQGKGEV